MAHLLEGVSPKIPMRSAILGAFSLFLQFLGYFSLSAYMYGRSRLYGSILFVSIAFFIVLGTAHLAAIVPALGCHFHHIADIYPAVSISNHRYITYRCDDFHVGLDDPAIRK